MKLQRLPKLAIIAGIVLFAGSAGLALFLNHFPWIVSHMPSGDSPQIRNEGRSTFSIYWPSSAMEEEKVTRKSLKRMARSEQQRRLAQMLQRTSVSYVPVFQANLERLEWSQNHFKKPASLAGSGIDFPCLKTGRSLQNVTNLPPSLCYFPLPSVTGVQFFEGIQLDIGDEVKTNFYNGVKKRFLRIKFLPRTSGQLRASVGQSVWSKAVAEDEVNVIQSHLFPVLDKTANNLRFQALSASVILTELSILERQNTGRDPIQVSGNSAFWQVPPPSQNHSLSAALGTPGSSGNDGAGATSTSGADDEEAVSDAEDEESNKIIAPSTAPAPAHPLPSVVTAPAQQMQQLSFDFLDELKNPVIPTKQGRSTALGYNLLMIQFGKIEEPSLRRALLDKKFTPHLEELGRQAATFQISDLNAESPKQIFWETVNGNSLTQSDQLDPLVQKSTLETLAPQSLFGIFRRFGYFTGLFGRATDIGMEELLSENVLGVNDISGRYLTHDDALLLQKSSGSESTNDTAAGLEAVFQGDQGPKIEGMSARQWLDLGRRLRLSTFYENRFPDWLSHQMIMRPNGAGAIPSVTLSAQNFLKEQAFRRFFLYLLVNQSAEENHFTAKDVIKSFGMGLKHGNLFNRINWEQNTRIATIERVLGLIKDSLVAKRIAHRTLVVLLFPHASAHNIPAGINETESTQKLEGSASVATKDNTKGSTTALVILPGVRPHHSQKWNVSLVDFRASLAHWIGVPNGFMDGQNLEEKIAQQNQGARPPEKTAPALRERSPLFRYQLLVLPGKNGCAPLRWNALTKILDVRSSEPIIEKTEGGLAFSLYPCALGTHGAHSIVWYQKLVPSNETNSVPLTASHSPRADQSLMGILNTDAVARAMGGRLMAAQGHDENTGSEKTLLPSLSRGQKKGSMPPTAIPVGPPKVEPDMARLFLGSRLVEAARIRVDTQNTPALTEQQIKTLCDADSLWNGSQLWHEYHAKLDPRREQTKILFWRTRF